MADPTPLILSQTKSSDSDDSDPPSLLDQYLPSLDSIIEKCIGDKFCLAQFLQAIVVSLAWYFDAQQAFISIFADAQPTWHCSDQPSLPQQTSSIAEWALECAGSFIMGLPASAACSVDSSLSHSPTWCSAERTCSSSPA